MQWDFDPQIYSHIHAYFTSYKLYNALKKYKWKYCDFIN